MQVLCSSSCSRRRLAWAKFALKTRVVPRAGQLKGIVPVVEIYVGLPVAISWVPRHGQRGPSMAAPNMEAKPLGSEVVSILPCC